MSFGRTCGIFHGGLVVEQPASRKLPAHCLSTTVSQCLLASWSTQGSGEEKPQPTWPLSSPTHVVREPWLTGVKTRIHYLWSIHRCLSPTGNCHQSEVVSCLTLPSPLLQSEESPGWGLGGNRQSQDLPLSAPFCQNVVKQRGSIFHSTQLSIFLEDERTIHLDPWWTREEELHGSLTRRALTW